MKCTDGKVCKDGECQCPDNLTECEGKCVVSILDTSYSEVVYIYIPFLLCKRMCMRVWHLPGCNEIQLLNES